MKYWPVPASYNKRLPQKPEEGAFWVCRGDRYHCGVDIYATRRSKVIAIEDGKVIENGIFTSPDMLWYWNRTYFVVIHHLSGIYVKYAELGELSVNPGDNVKSGDMIGSVGEVLNKELIDERAPDYIRRLKNSNNGSMLHLEVYNRVPQKSEHYLGGNLFRGIKPEGLLDPNKYLT